jgi:multiple sugar transport system substrate-binding protein
MIAILRCVSLVKRDNLGTQENNKMETGLSRRHFLRLTAGALAGAAVTACVPAAAPQTTTESTGAEGAEPAGEKITIEFMNWWGAQREALLNESIALFNELHPNIEVVNSLQPWDRRAERAATAIASRTPPGVIMTRREETYKFAHEGLIVPVTEYVAARGLNVDEMFFAADLDNQRWQGELWSLPLPGDGASASLYLYNKQLLSEAGFENPPSTWQELEEVARAITEIDGGIQVLGVDVGTGAAFPVWLYCNNGQYCSDDAKQILFNSEEGVEALQWMVNVTNEISGGIENVRDFFAGIDGTSPDFPFYQDRFAVYFTGTWAFDHMETQDVEMWTDTDKWGVALRPYNANRSGAASHGTSGLQWGWGYTIPSALPKEVQDAAYEWVEWWITQPRIDEPGGCQFLFTQSQVSALTECTNDPAWYDGNPYWDVVVSALGIDVSVPITPVQSQITAFLNEAVEQAMFGQQTPQEALDLAAERGQALLDEFWSEG